MNIQIHQSRMGTQKAPTIGANLLRQHIHLHSNHLNNSQVFQANIGQLSSPNKFRVRKRLHLKLGYMEEDRRFAFHYSIPSLRRKFESLAHNQQRPTQGKCSP